MVKNKSLQKKGECKVYSADLYGLRENKYIYLNEKNLNDIDFEEVVLSQPLYLFKKQDDSKKDKYDKFGIN